MKQKKGGLQRVTHDEEQITTPPENEEQTEEQTSEVSEVIEGDLIPCTHHAKKEHGARHQETCGDCIEANAKNHKDVA